MICEYLDCGCVVSIYEVGGLVVGCDGIECEFQEWYDKHLWCVKCGFGDHCCQCPERFGI